jgi:NAD(P)-dependent dehydrogenase (short-subunit alcohol dehydrogenase family)
VQLVNAIAPYILNARLKPLMLQTPERHKHVVNVSAMEGQFCRATKIDKHLHTNMAKAALNMMTRTSALDFVKDGIHMNAVDTGWVTDEDPVVHAARKADLGFSPPLDITDGAARIVDPYLRRAAHGHARLRPVPEGLQAGALVVSGAPLLYVLKKFWPCHLTELYVNKRVFAYSLTIIVGACLICGSLKAR